MSSIRIIFLGTSSAIPTSTRGLSSVAVIRDGVVHLFDAGEGIQSSFIQNKILNIFHGQTFIEIDF